MSRIITGTLASQRVISPPGVATRPTTDRVREAIFSVLASWYEGVDRDSGQQLEGVQFLDLYAGSGVVGLEAYSRGAAVTWVDKATTSVIEKNLDRLHVRGTVKRMDVERFLHGRSTQFDIVWMDPPYENYNESIYRILTLLRDQKWLKIGGFVLIERSSHTSAVEFPESFISVGQRRYGGTIIYHAEMGNQ